MHHVKKGKHQMHGMQILTDFQNTFTDTLISKFAAK